MTEPPPRRAARVIVMDVRERLLLFGYRNPRTGEEFWAVPGGGIEPGETPHQAARREFLEETTHEAPADLGPVVWHRLVRFPWGDEWHHLDEVFFFARVGDLPISDAHVESLVTEGVIGHRWLTLDEIRAREGFEFAPRDLADLVSDLMEHGPPARPIDVGL